MKRDRLFAENLSKVEDFVFDQRVAEVFADMIRRSVPGYGTIISAIGAFAAERVTAGSQCYDLGCSLGAGALAIRHGAGDTPCRIFAVDNSLPMLEQARQFLDRDEAGANIDLICADIQDIRIEQASLVVLNFTLQFIPPEQRARLLGKIHAGMRPGGMLVLSEKIALSSSREQDLFTEMHHAFKRAQGYSELEISQKRTALENVLLPESLSVHVKRLRDAGFGQVESWFQCFNFISLLAIK
jgi:tRNA (cmo5U34)-methyltransferase